MDRATAAALLGVRPDAGSSEVDAAFRVLAGLTHPDRFPVGSASWEDANRGMQSLVEARRVLATTPAPRPYRSGGTPAYRLHDVVPEDGPGYRIADADAGPRESVPSWERSPVGQADPVTLDRRMRNRAFGWGALLLASSGISFAVGAAQPVNDALPFWSPALALTGLLSIATGWRAHRRLLARDR
ncbi:MAG: hypothetical protein AB7O74_11475 [Candidatus Nanopelagicales bacterium]